MRERLTARIAACAVVLLAASQASSAGETATPGVTRLSVTGAARPGDNAEASARKATGRAAVQSKGVCKAGFDVRTDQHVLEHEGFGENPPGAVVRIRKPCRGAVVVRFAAAVTAPTLTDVLYLQLHARCVGKAGFADACTKGEDLFGFPGGYGLDLVTGPVSGSPVHSTQWIYSDLKPGKWKFSVLVARYTGEGVTIAERSLTVDAYVGG